jgi:catechol 2,3-dioxygenase-like lactoylglutathione lyase family enzyme
MSKPPVASSPTCLLDSEEDFDPAYLPDYRNNSMKILAANTIIYCQSKHWPASVHFYRDVLQLAISFQKDDWFIEFVVNGAAHLSIADAARCTIPPGSGVGLTLSFFVQDLRAAQATFTEHKIATTEIKAKGWRAPYFYVHDPEGTRIEFWTRNLK